MNTGEYTTLRALYRRGLADSDGIRPAVGMAEEAVLREEAFRQSLSEELLDAYEALTRDWEELTQREAEQAFVQGFRSGARITLESLTPGEDDPAE